MSAPAASTAAVSSHSRPKPSTGSAAMPPTPKRSPRLYLAKGRPSFNPLIAHVADLSAARKIAQFDADAEKLAQKFWPGPLTLVLPKAAACNVAELATAGLDTIAVRVPSHPFARKLVAAFGKPVVAPSANRSGHVSPTTAAHVRSDLAGRIDLIADGGSAEVGVEIDHRRLLRRQRSCCGPAACRVPRSNPCSATSWPTCPAEQNTSQPLAPGLLTSHYAPRAAVRLNATHVGPGEAVLAFGPNAVRRIGPGCRHLEPVGTWRSHRGRRKPVRPFARARCHACDAHRGNADSGDRPRRSNQRPSAPRRCLRDFANEQDGANHATVAAGAPGALRKDRRRAQRIDRPERHRAISDRGPRPLSRPLAAGAAAGLDRRSRSDRKTRQRDEDRDRAAGRQHRPCRRPDGCEWRGRRLACAASTRSARSTRTIQHHDLRGRRRARGRAAEGAPMSTGCFRCRSAPRAAAPSAATSRPMPAAPRHSPMAWRAISRSASRSCCPTAAC